MDEPVDVPIEDHIDLHTFQPREIGSVVEEYLYQAFRRGYREVRVIHGRGKGVQRAIVQSILIRHPLVLSYSDAADLGATVVRLRPQERP
jgi:DNA-nicking Smr family endonuclease